jgi:large subunit ribosomal protein L10
MGIRREFNAALRKVDEAMGKPHDGLASGIKIQIIQTGIFAAALKIVEFYDPAQSSPPTHPSDTRTQSSVSMPNTTGSSHDPQFRHTLSRAAHEAVANQQIRNGLKPLLSGPLALVTFPTVSPQHLKAALSILAPNAPNYPAPTRRGNPGYHEPVVQSGLQKLMLLGARIEGKTFDMEGTRSVGLIEGGIDGLRAQLVGALQGVSAGITSTLESAGRSLYITVEGRRGMLDDDRKDSPT